MKSKPDLFPTLGAAFLHRSKHAGDKLGFRHKVDGSWVDVTFREQYDAVRTLSAGLMKNGVSKGDAVAIIAGTSLIWGRMEMALMGASATIIPIYPTNTAEDVEYILNHSEAKFVFCDSIQGLEKVLSVWKSCPKLKGAIAGFRPAANNIPNAFADRVVTLQALQQTGAANLKSYSAAFEENLRNQAPGDIYTICYTSGTTGLPKGVLIAHECMMSALNDTATVVHGIAHDGDELLSFLPMSHIFGRFESYTPYVLGFVANYAESIDTLLPNMQEVKPTLFLSVPRIFEKAYTRISEMMTNEGGAKLTAFRWALQVGKKWLEEKRAAKSGRAGITTELQYLAAKKIVFDKIKNRFGGKLRLTLSGGAPLPDSIADFMEMVGIPIYQGYGLTETCAPICVNTPLNNKPGTVGKLFPDVLVRIADDGEILVKSMKNFKGYYKDPESTNEAIRDGWFYTGDIGHLDGEGYLKITDRKKDLIKTAGGKFVAPQRIENIAKTSPIVNQIVVYGDQKPYITALVTLHQEAVIKFSKEKKLLASEFSSLIKSPDVAQLVSNAIEEINRQLPRWETIKRFHVLPMEFTVESGELTPSLKVKRKLLTKKYQDVLESLYIKK
jgi:long-chain acyl-CoA synthetase